MIKHSFTPLTRRFLFLDKMPIAPSCAPRSDHSPENVRCIGEQMMQEEAARATARGGDRLETIEPKLNEQNKESIVRSKVRSTFELVTAIARANITGKAGDFLWNESNIIESYLGDGSKDWYLGMDQSRMEDMVDNFVKGTRGSAIIERNSTAAGITLEMDAIQDHILSYIPKYNQTTSHSLSELEIDRLIKQADKITDLSLRTRFLDRLGAC